jgi:hypothetical protein
MKKRNVLKEIYERKITEVQAEEILNAVLDSPEAGLVATLLGFSNVEWTAYAQGGSLDEIATWRYVGWPKNCVICGLPISVGSFGWFVVDVSGASKLKHIMCKIPSRNGLKAGPGEV